MLYGRAHRSHRWGHRFESCCDHQLSPHVLIQSMRTSFCIYRLINRQNTGYNCQIRAMDARSRPFCVILSDEVFHSPAFFASLCKLLTMAAILFTSTTENYILWSKPNMIYILWNFVFNNRNQIRYIVVIVNYKRHILWSNM